MSTRPNHHFMALFSLWKRELVRFFRQRSRVFGTIATPLLFWLVIGGGLKNSFQSPDQPMADYLDYFYPGTIVLSVLFTAIFSTISVIEDRNQGFLQGVLVTSVPRSTIVLSKILGGASLGIIQGTLFLALAPFVFGAMGLVQWIQSLVLLFAMAAALTGLGFYFAWKINSVQGYHGVMNVVLVPLWLLSGAVFPVSGAHWVLKNIARVNPLTYGVEAFRGVLASQVTSALWLPACLLMVLCALLFVFINTRMMNRSSVHT
jgi:ABC-2 type transport system permease protein